MINNGGTVNDASGIGGTVMNSGFLFARSAGGSVTNTGTMGLSQGSPLGSVFAITGSLTSNVPNPTPSILNVRFNGTTADSYTATTGAALAGDIKLFGSGTNLGTPIVTTTGGIITIGGDHILNDPNGLITVPSTGVLFSAHLQLIDANTRPGALHPPDEHHPGRRNGIDPPPDL